ncbi:MAG: imidazole glycerol phosphate synthase subunit HisH [Spirochaetota bacterium]|nr:MAG: imidazole glycerol phosphate synthase subunit HisH [Spirochaetota bacterium]
MITIIDLGISNIKSITRGFITQGFDVEIASSSEEVEKSSSLVLPGVGAFPKAVETLKKMGLFKSIVDHAAKGKPLLGVCLGMQLLFTDSDEHTKTQGLDIIPGHVMQFPADRQVPHMGWNEVVQHQKCTLFQGIPDRSDFYFVHSYYGVPDQKNDVVASTDYYSRFACAVQRENVYGVQFHPEKSQKLGLLLLCNFAMMTEY